MTISTAAIGTANAINQTSNKLQKSFSALSSGSRLSSLGIDPAAVSIASALSGQTRGMQAAYNNIQDASNAQNIAAGALSSQQEGLQRLRELAVQGANGTNSAASSGALQAEASQITAQLDQVASSTQFNGKSLLDGSLSAPGSFNVQTGPNAGNSVDISSGFAAADSASLGLGGLDLSTQAGSTAAISAIDNALAQVNDQMATLGASSNALSSAADNLSTSIENTSAAFSRLNDTDFASEVVNQKNSEFALQAQVSMLKSQQQVSASLLSLLK